MLFAAILAVSGCKKEGGIAGKKTIVGTVYYDDGTSPVDAIAPGATVYLTYNSKVSGGAADETTTSDSKGAYSFKKLTKGDYFVWAEYITSHGFKYVTPGYGVTIEAGKDNMDLNIRLY